jgi:hypothetical protein
MKRNGKRLVAISILFVALNMIPHLVRAQDPGDPGGDPDAPIDGGVSLLVAAGIGYGIKKVRESRKGVKNEELRSKN